MLLIIIFIVLLFLFIILIATKPKYIRISRKLKNYQSEYKFSDHQYTKSDRKGLYFCNVCKKLLLGLCGPNSYQCNICGLLVHKKCKSNDLECKHTSCLIPNKQHQHQWLTGNLALNSVCCHCGLICGYFYDLEGKSCLWCQRVVHEECRQKIPQLCDYGDFKDILIQPTFEQTSLKPIIVVINQKSGGQSGLEFFKSFNQLLNPIQIIDIVGEGLERLKSFKNYKNAKIIIAGGDGTVASVINFVKSFDWNPPIAILPLGTGNDLSRALGWGGTYETLDGTNILQQVSQNENVAMLDRWNVEIDQNKKQQTLTMFNYFGIGLDAKFCYDFHNLRSQSPQLFKSRIGNKFIYTQMGLNDLISGNKGGLGKTVKLICDGVAIQVPDEVENIIVLNINSWSGGVTNLWNPEGTQFKYQRMNDGLLEIIGVSSILHLGRIQVGLDEPFQIAQGREITIQYGKGSHIQVDGEPLKVGGCEIKIKLIDKIQMLSNIDHVGLPNWEAKFIKTMEWAEEEKMINSDAKHQIMYRMLH